MEDAMLQVQAARLTFRQAAAQFGVPKTTLQDRVSGRVASDCIHGLWPLLSTIYENALVVYCLYSASYGFPLTKPQVQSHALAIYNRRHQESPKVALSQTWWINFKERHH
ncbi:hypothetical protein WMY93_031855 [Mugilogobius chulae]|uniref:HTH CENPB-type domain-containing protein n=1 Tax=Mugilogobius chulae TaxID=88201 RepID=A0AAW0MES4_9GOBI